MDYTAHGILQARIPWPELVAIPLSKESSQPWDQTQVSHIAGDSLPAVSQGKPDKPRPCIKKQRYHFADKSLYSQSYGFFSLDMYGCESWTIKKGEHGRINAFKLWY